MYYVLCVDQYGSTIDVKEFKTRPEAIAYMESLDDKYFMVILRNDALAHRNRFE